jgi:glutathione S-transferase
MSLELYSSVSDSCLLKVKLLAALVNLDLQINHVSDAELAVLDNSAKGLVLKTPGGYLSQHIPILKYIAGTSASALLGGEEIDRAQVNQWLEFAWQDLGKFDLQLIYLS